MNQDMDTAKRLVVEHLDRNGWSEINAGSEVPDPVDIIASQDDRSVIILVSPGLGPGDPDPLKQEDIEMVKVLAKNSNADPYQVKVTTDPEDDDMYRIAWVKL